MSMPLDGALYISNGRKRHGTSTPRVLSGLGDLMAFTISNPFYMNRRKRRGSKAKTKAAKRRQRDAKGRFLTKSRSRSKSRSKALGRGKRRAAQRRGKRMTARQIQALARRYGFTAQVRRPKKRVISAEHKAKMKAARAENQAKLKARYGTGTNVGDIFAGKPMSREALMAERAAVLEQYGGVPRSNRTRRNRTRRNGLRTRRNGLYERGINVIAQTPFGLGNVAVSAALVATAVGAHLLFAKGVNMAADASGTVAEVRNYVAPVGFTATGLAVKYGLVPTLDAVESIQFLGVGPGVKALRELLIYKTSVQEVADMALFVGVALDTYRYFKGTSSTFGALNYGDGTAYEIVPYSNQYGPMANANVMYGAIEGGGLYYGSLVYGDADLSDAAHCGTDLSGAELSAARSGMNAYATRFPSSGSAATRVAGRPSVNAGREGYRWGWMIKLVGFERFQQIAALPAGQRCRVIAQLRLQAMQSLQSIINGTEMALPDHSSPVNSSPTMAGLDYAGLNYGGFVYAGV